MPTETRVAAWLDSYRLDLKTALRTASADGFKLLEANTIGPELDPRGFARSARRHLLRFLGDLGIGLSALAVEFPGLGLSDPRHADARLDHLRRTLEMCAELGVRRAAASVSGSADECTSPLACELLQTIGEMGDRVGVVVALKPGGEDPAPLVRELRRLACPALAVALDSGLQRLAPDAGTGLRGLVGNAYVRDVRCVGQRLEEVPLGQGQVDFPTWLALLAESDYGGPLVVRRDAAGAGPQAMRQGREYLSCLLQAGSR